MIRFKLDGKPYSLPDTWTEVPRAQLEHVLAARLGAFDNTALRVRLLVHLTGVNRHLLHLADTSDVLDLCALLDWLWAKEVPGGLIDEFSHAGVTYLLPAADFSTITLGEYVMIEHHLRMFTVQESLPDLYQLVATVCRPQRRGLDRDAPEWDGDAREPYSPHLAARRVDVMMAVPLATHQLVLAHVLQGQRHVHAQYPHLFKAAEGGGGPAPEAVEGSPLLDLAYSLADKGVFGDFERTCQQGLYTVLEYLDSKRRQEK